MISQRHIVQSFQHDSLFFVICLFSLTPLSSQPTPYNRIPCQFHYAHDKTTMQSNNNNNKKKYISHVQAVYQFSFCIVFVDSAKTRLSAGWCFLCISGQRAMALNLGYISPTTVRGLEKSGGAHSPKGNRVEEGAGGGKGWGGGGTWTDNILSGIGTEELKI